MDTMMASRHLLVLVLALLAGGSSALRSDVDKGEDRSTGSGGPNWLRIRVKNQVSLFHREQDGVVLPSSAWCDKVFLRIPDKEEEFVGICGSPKGLLRKRKVRKCDTCPITEDSTFIPLPGLKSYFASLTEKAKRTDTIYIDNADSGSTQVFHGATHIHFHVGYRAELSKVCDHWLHVTYENDKGEEVKFVVKDWEGDTTLMTHRINDTFSFKYIGDCQKSALRRWIFELLPPRSDGDKPFQPEFIKDLNVLSWGKASVTTAIGQQVKFDTAMPFEFGTDTLVVKDGSTVSFKVVPSGYQVHGGARRHYHFKGPVLQLPPGGLMTLRATRCNCDLKENRGNYECRSQWKNDFEMWKAHCGAHENYHGIAFVRERPVGYDHLQLWTRDMYEPRGNWPKIEKAERAHEGRGTDGAVWLFNCQ